VPRFQKEKKIMGSDDLRSIKMVFIDPWRLYFGDTYKVNRFFKREERL
jgi:hypothetical protein